MGLVKIGCADNAVRRLGTLQVGSPTELVLRGVFHTDDAPQFEADLHARFAHLRVRGEWFRLHPDMDVVLAGLCSPGEAHMTISYKPPSYVPGSLVIVPKTGESTEDFALRICRLMEADGHEIEYDAVEPA